MQRRMGAIRMAQGVLAVLGLASACQAQPGEIGHAWFVRNLETKQWCAFVDEARAALAAEDEGFDWSESSWLKYGEDRPLTLLVALQSEDAYVEDCDGENGWTWIVEGVISTTHFSRRRTGGMALESCD